MFNPKIKEKRYKGDSWRFHGDTVIWWSVGCCLSFSFFLGGLSFVFITNFNDSHLFNNNQMNAIFFLKK
jgi:hypothetical protein